MVVMATVKDEDADGEWHGISRKVKASIKAFEDRLVKNNEKDVKAVKDEVADVKGEITNVKT